MGAIKHVRLFDTETITKNTTGTSKAVELGVWAASGIFSIALTVTGSGTLTITYLLAFDKTATFVTPTGAVDIIAGFVSSSGTSGVDIISFSPEPAKHMKIAVTETVTTDDAVITLDLLVQ